MSWPSHVTWNPKALTGSKCVTVAVVDQVSSPLLFVPSKRAPSAAVVAPSSHAPPVFDEVIGLSNEVRLKLNKHRPTSLAQAGQIDGMTPAALMLVLAQLRKRSGAVAVG